MKKVQFSSALDYNVSPYSGWTPKHYQEIFRQLMQGIINSASPAGARQRIPGQRSHHGMLADELEGFTRTFIMAGPWLNQNKSGKFELEGQTYDVAEFYRKGILAGTDPKHPEYWGDVYDYAQHLVEMASMAWAIYQSKLLVWDKFSKKEQKQVADYMFQCTKVTYHNNNWLLFNVINNSVLKQLGMPYEQEQIDKNIVACDNMYLGEGWYMDGHTANRIDYYNAWAFHYYYLIWCILDGDSKPELRDTFFQRMRDFSQNFPYFFSNDGSVPCWGRSMIYRFGYLAPFALGKMLNCIDIPVGEMRTMYDLGLKFYFDQEILSERDHLSMGFIKPCTGALEHYNCGGSPYWAVKAFNIFMLPREDDFWQAKEEALPIHKGDFKVPIKSAGLILSGDQRTGHVQLINHKSFHEKDEYNAKYTNFAYSSIFSYDARTVYGSYNCDNSFSFSEDGINFFQRWKIEDLYIEKDFAASRAPLYDKVDENGKVGADFYRETGTVTSYTLLKDDFMLNLHRVETDNTDLTFKEGGYPLGFDDGEAVTESCENGEFAGKNGKFTFIRRLHGWQKQQRALPFHEQVCGVNVRYRTSVVPCLEGTNGKDKVSYFASMVLGRQGNDSLAQCMGLVTDFSMKDGEARVTFYDGEEIYMQLGEIQDVKLTLAGEKISGRVIMARSGAGETRTLTA